MSISERMAMPEAARRIEAFTGAGRRRSWSVAEKAAIVAESYAHGETVCGVARRHGLTPSSCSLGGAWRAARLPPPRRRLLRCSFLPWSRRGARRRLLRACRHGRAHRSPAAAIELDIVGVAVRVGT